MGNIGKTRGDYGEEAVCRYLLERGYAIISRNYRKRSGEIDIIAVFADVIAFIEVKTRKFGGLTDGIAAVTKDKRRRIAETARRFLEENPRYYGKKVSFDVAEVVITADIEPQLLSVKYYGDAYDYIF